MTQKKILVADDEKEIIDLVAYNLEQEGYTIIRTYHGQKAWEMVNLEKPDLLILNLEMPKMSGIEVFKKIRRQQTTASLPIIMMTAKSETVDKVLGLEIGADDCITKPFHVRELIARVQAVLRRSERYNDLNLTDSFDCRGLHINFKSYQVSVDGKPVELSALEFKLLRFLVGDPGRVYSREQLLDHVWGYEAIVGPRTVDALISRLRCTIEPDKENPKYIQTIRSIGYMFNNEKSEH